MVNLNLRYFQNMKEIIPDWKIKIMALYAAGMTTIDITEQIKNLYDGEISAEVVSNITN